MVNQSIRICICLIMSCFLLSCSNKNQLARDILIGDLLIKGGSIIDGSGTSRYKGDIIILGDKIVWIGNADEQNIKVDSTIFVAGKTISPGFIDIHAHGDPTETPDFENFLAMGVTSIALGMDGGSLKSNELSGWFNGIRDIGTGVNILPFIGHGTIRTESGIGMSSTVSKPQIDSMAQLANHALDMGCWGLSMGLEYMPGYHADSTELIALAKVVGQHDAMITSHIRNEDEDQIESSLSEMINLAAYCNVNISHLKVVYGKGSGRAKQIINKLEAASRKKFKVTADLYPYNASYTGIGIVFPDWAKVPTKYAEIKKERGEELLEFLNNKIRLRNGPEATLFGTAPYAGKTLQDLVDEYKQPHGIILRDIIGPYGASAAYFVMNDELQTELLKSSLVMVASDGSPTMRHPRGYGTFSKVIEEFTIKDSLLTIEAAINKMTGLPAQTLGLHNRGIIKAGAKADILIFDPNAIRANASFESPHLLASGMDAVILNGKVVWKDGAVLDRAGLVVLKE